jgi:very-long-chain ceramide synthase
MFIWIYLRHYLNLRIIVSLFTEFKTVGPYVMDWEGGQFKCPLSFFITLSLLSSLQALNLFWLFFILRIAYRFIVRGSASDDRSDAEDSEAEAEDQPETKPIQEKADGVKLLEPTTTTLLNGSGVPANGRAKVAAANGSAKKSKR